MRNHPVFVIYRFNSSAVTYLSILITGGTTWVYAIHQRFLSVGLGGKLLYFIPSDAGQLFNDIRHKNQSYFKTLRKLV